MVLKVADFFNYTPLTFTSLDDKQKPIYHTNVVLSILEKNVIICLDAVKDESQKNRLLAHFNPQEKGIIPISYEQVKSLCGNVLELEDAHQQRLLVLSTQALKQFNNWQLKGLEKHAQLLPIDVQTIEAVGGGGVRCMMAEVFHRK